MFKIFLCVNYKLKMKNNSKQFERQNNYGQKFTFYSSGTFQKEGIYICKNCGQKLFLSSEKKLPVCTKCGQSVFTKQE